MEENEQEQSTTTVLSVNRNIENNENVYNIDQLDKNTFVPGCINTIRVLDQRTLATI